MHHRVASSQFLLHSRRGLLHRGPALGKPWEQAHARPIEGLLLVSLGSKRMPAAPPAPELSCAGAEEARWKSSLAPLPGASSADKNMELSGLELLLAVSTFSIFSLRTFCRTALAESLMLLIFSTERGRRKAKLARVLVLVSRWFAPRAASGAFTCETIGGLNHRPAERPLQSLKHKPRDFASAITQIRSKTGARTADATMPDASSSSCRRTTPGKNQGDKETCVRTLLRTKNNN